MGDHDTLFKRAFAVPEHASGELRSVLPPNVVSALDLDHLELLPGSFVDAEMAGRHTDLLFRAPMKTSPASAMVYFLIEHQSEPDPLMPYRVLEYVLRIWAAILRAEPGRTRLPPVLTVVVHHGAGGWSAPRRMHDLIEGLDSFGELASLVPDVELLVDDLATQDDQALLQRPLAPFPKVALWLLRDGRSIEHFFEHLGAWARELEALVHQAPGRQDILVVMRYILRVAGETPFDVIQQRIAQAAPAAEEPMASAAEQLIQQGIEKGRSEMLRETLARLLRVKFGEPEPWAAERIDAATAEQLGRWVERVLTASRAEDVFEP